MINSRDIRTVSRKAMRTSVQTRLSHVITPTAPHEILFSNIELNVDIVDHIGVEDHLSCWRVTRASGVDDIYRRLGNIEAGASELGSEVSAILAIIPHLATKAELAATKAELKSDIAKVETAIADVKTLVASKETAMIKWIIASVLTAAGLAVTIAKLVH